MAPSQKTVLPPSSSPTPVHEMQPQINSLTTTTHGTEPHHALYDTPPPDTQHADLKRSDRARKISARGCDTIEWTGKPLAGRSHSQPNPAPAESPAAPLTHNRKTAKKRVKWRALRFDEESSDDEPP
ncbi:hypothetical protein FRC10_000497 [Ceratobasidium sp. 414]|nr:hypothetical protein FRC10_000497 [Ceratobasidium sp. 414]